MKSSTLALAILTVGVGVLGSFFALVGDYHANRTPDGFHPATWEAFVQNEPRLARAAVWVQQAEDRRDFRDAYLHIVDPGQADFEGHASAGKVLENRMTGNRVTDLHHQARIFYMQIDLMLRLPEAPVPKEVFSSICARKMIEIDREIEARQGTGERFEDEKQALLQLSNLIRDLGGRQPDLMNFKLQVATR